MTTRFLSRLLACLACAASLAAQAPATSKLKEEMRMPWSRSHERFIRNWLVAGDFPLADGFDKDWLTEHGGEAAIRPAEKMAHHLPNGSTVQWRKVTAWGDATDVSDGSGLKRELVAYAFTTVPRKQAGKARLCVGSDESIRVWVNGAPVLDRRTQRPLTFDEDQVEIGLEAGDNTVLVKLEQRTGPWTFSLRILESGAVPQRLQEIGPALEASGNTVAIKTDINKDRAELDKVTVVATAAGGRVAGERTAARGETVRFDTSAWPDGAYEFRCTTRRQNGLLYATHLPWYKGDPIAAARVLVAAAAKADTKTPAGMTTKMLGDMIVDRLGKEYTKVTGNPWWVIHSPLMEYEELRLEAAGKDARRRPYGFYRFAYIDDVDGSPQFCRAYLPGGYDPAKKWPLVVKIHGYNGANPEYVRWWSADARHTLADVEYAGRQGIIYMEPHGRGNTTYLGLGDRDIVRVIKLAKERFSVDEDRVYLAGDSMGGWGTWNVATRHADLLAAIAPIFGGADYHSQLSEEQLAKLTPLDRFLQDKGSSWSMAESLLHVPILVHHGDVDRSVNVDYSRYGVRLLQRWGYDVRYVELPGYGHEELNVMGNIVDWLLEHRRVSNPMRVRLRSAELENASQYWVRVEQAASPKEFMVIDAEVTGPNAIRLDSENVLAVSLSPGAALVNPAKPLKVVWNGEPRTAKLKDGRVMLRVAGYEPAAVEKNAKVAGPIGDLLNTPFAIVVGTSSPDAAMNQVCRRKGEAAVKFWSEWQRQPPRVFKDTELSGQDAGKYSLLLIGGADANLIARKFGDKLPVRISGDQVNVGGRAFTAPDARVQAILPNPANPQRYVLLVAATSPDGMYFWTPDRVRNAEFDFTIEDGHIAAGRERMSPSDIWVAGGWFDRRWQVDDSLVVAGNAEVRAKSAVLHAPRPDRAIDTKILDSYAGAYQLGPGFVVKVTRKDKQLIAQAPNQPDVDLLPVSDTEFVILEVPLKIVFEKDSSGKVTAFRGWANGQEFFGKKTE